MSLNQGGYQARLATLLGEVAREGRTGRLQLAGDGAPEVGSLAFIEGRVCGFTPPGGSPESPPGSDAASLRRRVGEAAAAVAAAATGPSFAPEPALETPPPSASAATAGDLALDAARRIQDEAWLGSRLPGRARPKGHPAPPASGPRSAAGPLEGFLISRADGTLTVSEILQTTSFDRLDALRGLFGLLVTGLICLDVAEEQETAAKPARVGLSKLDQFLRQTADVGTADPTPGTSAPPGVSREQQEEWQRLIRMCETVPKQDYYTMLGVDRGASESRIRQGYYSLARLYHPDRLLKPHLAEMHSRLERMFGYITEAYNTLIQPALRAEYDRARTTGHHDDGPDKAIVARELFAKGRRQMEAGDAFEAIRLFEAAIEKDPSRADYHHHLGVCQAQNPRWKQKAAASLQKAIDLDPAGAVHYLELARVYRQGGLETRALEFYSKVLEWEPDNEEARAALAGEQPGKQASAKGGLLSGIFRKG